MFSDKDYQQFQRKGITKEQVLEQFNLLKDGECYSNLISSAFIGTGIEKYSPAQTSELVSFYRKEKESKTIVKFVPASGAASRMFKFLFSFIKQFNPKRESLNNYFNRTGDQETKVFIDNIENFPFYDIVVEKLKSRNPNIHSLTRGELYVEFVKAMLNDDALNYSFLPKGLLIFHKYSDGVKTAFQEHLFESTLYASSNGKSNLHFTVSKSHYNCFKTELDRIKEHLENETNTKFEVSFSFQKESTDVIALTCNDTIFRENDDSILFRPGGHGALIENLNALDFDLIFIKNIDNIVRSKQNIALSEYKELLAGVLLKAQDTVFKYLDLIDKGKLSNTDFQKLKKFATEQLNIVFDDNFSNFPFQEKLSIIKDKLNRPIRVCGMVKNDGEPGGGPFWVKDSKGGVSLQIVEYAQININDISQAEILKNANYFSPTDLVCGVKNYKGEKFDLKEFVDPNAIFLSSKSVNGIDVKIIELPGLWNGSMAYWNSIFVEVPANTFNPVKTVNDLLRPAHLGKDITKNDLAIQTKA